MRVQRSIEGVLGMESGNQTNLSQGTNVMLALLPGSILKSVLILEIELGNEYICIVFTLKIY